MTNYMDKIAYFVVLVLENRSFDNVVGWLYADQNNRPKYNIPPFPEGREPVYYGLFENQFYNQFQDDATKHYIQKGADNCSMPGMDPHETFCFVNRQLFELQNCVNPTDELNPTMGGFLADYATLVPTHEQALQIMQTYTPDQLPILNGLAKAYAISDMWFSSVPSQTDCNRGFIGAGTSEGYTDNDYAEEWFDSMSIWNFLFNNNKDISWKIYHQDEWLGFECYTKRLFKQLWSFKDDAKWFPKMDQFYTDAANGSLPMFSFLEPAWYESSLGNGNDYHPPGNTLPGEEFLLKVFSALTQNTDAWNDTLFVVTFDEHGGCYDHISPPWNAMPPWGPPPATNSFLQHGFKFDRFGVRVPTLLISPRIQAQTVFRSEKDWPKSRYVPYDHTSIIATLLKWKGFGPADAGLGKRVANAPTFENVITLEQPRTDIPSFHTTSCTNFMNLRDMPLNSLQIYLLPLLVYNLTNGRLDIGTDGNRMIVKTIRARCRTKRDLDDYVAQFRSLYSL
jgi:phospholipase C